MLKNPCHRADLVRITTHDHTENFLFFFSFNIFSSIEQGGGVTVTPFLYHLVQGTLQNTHVNRFYSTYARLIRFCSQYVSLLFSVILLELA